MGRVTGMWVYRTLGAKPDPEEVAKRAQRHGLRWITAQAVDEGEIIDREWLRGLRSATAERGLKLGVHGYLGRPSPRPVTEAKALAEAARLAAADFAIANAEKEYEESPGPDSRRFVDAFRDREPDLPAFFSSFGRPSLHAGLDWQAWADGGFRGMPQAYENLNPVLAPRRCVDDWAAFFPRATMRPTLGCFTEHGRPRLAKARLVASMGEVPGLRFNVYRHGTVTTAELRALEGD